MKLRIDQHLNPYPFVQKPFDISVLLIDDHGHLKSMTEDMKLTVSLQLNDEIVSPLNQPKLLEIVENTGAFKNGSARVVVKFLDVSASYDRRKFVLIFQTNHPTLKVQAVHSIPMYCVRFKLNVQEESAEPYVWYKDEGGKDKCIEYRVSLRDGNNRTVRDRKVSLKLTLNYVNGTVVSHQNILVLSPDSRLLIDEGGDGLLKVRINEVSNRHRGQLFQVDISPDTAQVPSSADIAPTLCVPVDVKSKRNKGPNKTPRDDGPASALPGIDAKRQKLSTNSNISHMGFPSASSTAFPNSSASSLSNRRPALGVAASLTAAAVAMDENMASFNKSSHLSSNVNLDMLNSMNNMSSYVSMGESVNHIVNWAATIMRGVEAIQWREIGYERNPDGTPNLSRPLFNIPNPNLILNEIVEQYSNTVIPSLQQLQQIVDGSRLQNYTDGNNAIENDGGNQTPIDSDEDDENRNAGGKYEQTSNKLTLQNLSQLQMNNGSGLPKPQIARSNTFESIVLPDFDRSTSFAIPIDKPLPVTEMKKAYGLTLDMPEIKRNNSLYLDGVTPNVGRSGPSNVPIPALVASSSMWEFDNVFDLNGDTQSNLEAQIQYIVSEYVTTLSGVRGLPAFSASKQIVGVYREKQGGSTAIVLFQAPSASFERTVIDNITSKLDTYIAISNNGGSGKDSNLSSFFSLSNYISNGGITAMKEDAFIHSYESENSMG